MRAKKVRYAVQGGLRGLTSETGNNDNRNLLATTGTATAKEGQGDGVKSAQTSTESYLTPLIVPPCSDWVTFELNCVRFFIMTSAASVG